MVSPFNVLSATQFDTWAEQSRRRAIQGDVPNRIMLLATANPNWFAAQIYVNDAADGIGDTAKHLVYQTGDLARSFVLMSVIKPLLLLYLLEQFGAEQVFNWVGVQPSDQPFNSLDQLQADQGYPRNPMINSGAIALADKIPGSTALHCCQLLCDWLNDKAQTDLALDQAMLNSVRTLGQARNEALAAVLHQAGHLQGDGHALNTYQQICCLAGTVTDLARLGYLLAISSSHVKDSHRQAVNALMLTCGLYEASAQFAIRVGLPMKSGISGAMLAVVPGQGAIAVYSPPLDSIGNSVAGITLIEQLAQHLSLSCLS